MIIKQYTAVCNNGHKTTRPHNNILKCDICGQKVSWGWEVSVKRESNLTSYQLLEKVLAWLEKHKHYGGVGTLQECDGGETIIIADWNKISMKFAAFVEAKTECICGFSDEYNYCECGKLICTQPGYYGDQGNFFYTDGALLCKQCAIEDVDEIIEYVKNDSSRAIKTWLIKAVEKEGFTCLEKENEACPIYETGWYPGQNDNPREIAKRIEENLPNHDYLFAITDVGQFDVRWTVYVRREDV